MQNAHSRFPRTELLSTQLAVFLREQIVAGRLRPGERLVEQSLAAQCNVSRVPLREAFRILAAEGLVTLSPNRGASIAQTSPTELVELFEARAALEGAAALAAARRHDEISVAAMARAVKGMRAAVKHGNRAAYYRLAAEFHRTLLQSSANAVLVRLYEQIRIQLTRYQALMSAIPELPDRSIAEHQAIVDAIRSGDAASARARAEQHIGGLVEQFTTAAETALLEETSWPRRTTLPAG